MKYVSMASARPTRLVPAVPAEVFEPDFTSSNPFFRGQVGGGCRWLALLSVATALLGSPGSLIFAGLEVVTVPWNPDDPTVPHPAYNGHPTTFKAIARGCGGSDYSYSWDINNDGTFDSSATTSDPYNLGHRAILPHVDRDTLFTATIRVECGGEVAFGAYPVLVDASVPAQLDPDDNRTSSPQTATDEELQVMRDVAIDDGLWWIHLQMTDRAGTGAGITGGWRPEALRLLEGFATSAASRAFIAQGHLPAYPPGTYSEALSLGFDEPENDRRWNSNPYSEDLLRTFNWVQSRLIQVTVSPDDEASPPASGALPNVGLEVPGGSAYEQGFATGHLAISGLGGTTIQTGPHSGRAVEGIVQDMVDAIVHRQIKDTANSQYGGWHYSPTDSTLDGSTAQWMYIGLDAAESEMNGVSVQDAVKGRIASYLIHNQDAATGGALGYGGSCGPDGGPSFQLTGGALVGAGLLGWNQFDPADPTVIATDFAGNPITRGAAHQSFRRYADYLESAWDSAQQDCFPRVDGNFFNPGGSDPNPYLRDDGRVNGYALYSTQKGLRTALPGRRYIGIGHDWEREYATHVVRAQTGSGQWNEDRWVDGVQQYGIDGFGGVTGSSWRMLMLTPTLFDPKPLPVPLPDRSAVCVDGGVFFDGGGSFHPDPVRSVAEYRWDFGDGDTAQGPTVSHAYTERGDYTVILRVVDDAGRSERTALRVFVGDCLDLDFDNAGNQLDATIVFDRDTMAPQAPTTGRFPCDAGDYSGAARLVVTPDAGSAEESRGTFRCVWGGSGTGRTLFVEFFDDTCQLSPPHPTLFADVFCSDCGIGDLEFDDVVRDLDDNPTGTGCVDPCGAPFSNCYNVRGLESTSECDSEPLPRFQFDPPRAACGAVVEFDASDSAHTDPRREIVRWDWDFGDGNDVPDGGPVVEHVYSQFGEYTVRVTVTDDVGASRSDSLRYRVDADNLPPTSNAGGPYEVEQGGTVTLDGSGSFDIDAPCDSIRRYEWDVDFRDGAFDPDVSTTNPEVPISDATWFSGENRRVALRVTDRSGSSTVRTGVIQVQPGLDPATGRFEVIPVPWRPTEANPAGIPHPTYNGQPTNVKAIARGCGDVIQYSWDFGDGSPPQLFNTVDPYNLSATHRYPDSTQHRIYIARIDVDCGGQTASAIYRIFHRGDIVGQGDPNDNRTIDPDTLLDPGRRGWMADKAADDGLWWLHRDMSGRFGTGSAIRGTWPGGSDPNLEFFGTSTAVGAMLNAGHFPAYPPGTYAGAEPDQNWSDRNDVRYRTDPYAETVLRGLNFLMNNLVDGSIDPGAEADDGTVPLPFTNDGRGYSLPGFEVYDHGHGLAALARSGLRGTSPQVGNPIFHPGERVETMVQQMVDFAVFHQYDSGPDTGSWAYRFGEGSTDGSTAQWMYIGLEAAEFHMGQFGVHVPNQVTTRIAQGISDNARTDGYLPIRVGAACGTQGGPSHQYTGGGVFASRWLGWNRFDPADSTLYAPGVTRGRLRQVHDGAFNALGNGWTSPNLNCADWVDIPIRDGDFRRTDGMMNLYSIYSHQKGFRADRSNIPGTIGTHDWEHEFYTQLIRRQSADGQFTESAWQSGAPQIGVDRFGNTAVSALATELLLTPTVFRPNPVAIVSTPSACVGEQVTFDASQSTHPDLDRSIVQFDWDFGDGNTANGETVNHAYSAPGDRGVILTVVDDVGARSTTTLNVNVRGLLIDGFSVDQAAVIVHDSGGSAQNSVSAPVPGGVRVVEVVNSSGSPLVSAEVRDGRLEYNSRTDAAGGFNFTTVTYGQSPLVPPLDLSGVGDGFLVSTELIGSGELQSLQVNVVTDGVGFSTAFAPLDPSRPTATVFIPFVEFSPPPNLAAVQTIQLEVVTSAGGASEQAVWIDDFKVGSPPVSAPLPSFTFDPDVPACNQPVVFDGTGSSHTNPDRSISTFQWDFGDGSTDEGPVVSHVYDRFGTFTVELIATDNSSPPISERITRTILVNGGNQDPVADPGGPYPTAVGHVVRLDGRGSSAGAGDGTCDDIVRYEWDVDFDGAFEPDYVGDTVLVTDPTWFQGEIRSLALRVTDRAGATDIGATVIDVVLEGAQPPVAGFTTAEIREGCDRIVTFDGAESFHPDPTRRIVSWDWNFGDGETDSGPIAGHRYRDPNEYTVVLTVTDDQGDTAQTSTRVSVPDCIAFDMDLFGVAPDTVPVQVILDFDSNAVMNCEFGPPGSTCSQGCFRATGTLTIAPRAGAPPVLGLYGPQDGELEVFYQSTGSDPAPADLGLAFFSNSCGPTGPPVLFMNSSCSGCGDDAHTLRDVIQVIADSSSGLVGSGGLITCDPSPVNGSGPAFNPVTNVRCLDVSPVTADFTATPNPVECGQPVFFDGSPSTTSNPTASIVSWEWDFDFDGNTFDVDDTGPTVSQTYTSFGNFTPALRVTDSAGATDTATTDVTVEFTNAAPTADPGGPYDASLIAGSPVPLTLDGGGSSDPNADCGDSVALYEWDFGGDGTFELSDAGPTLELSADDIASLGLAGPADPGTGEPTNVLALRVTDSFGAENTATTALTVYENTPVAAFTANPNPAACNQEVTFDGGASSHGHPDHRVVSWDWDFGDGNTAQTDTPIVRHTFDRFDTFTVRLTVTDDNPTPRSNSGEVQVIVDQGNADPVADAGGPYDLDRGSDLTLNGGGSSDPDSTCGDSIATYRWEIGESSPVVATGENPLVPADQLILLPNATPVRVRLFVTDTLGSTSSADTELRIFDNSPVADLTADPNPAGCGQEVSFDASGSSHGRPDRQIVRYEWDFEGDGTFDFNSAAPTARFTYSSSGTFEARLRVTDDNDPARTDEVTVEVVANPGETLPSAVAGGPYEIDLDQTLPLNGTGSSDPDAACGDSIVSWDWDVGDDGTVDFSGETASVPFSQLQTLGVPVPTNPSEPIVVRLIVTDSTDRSGSDTTTLHIFDNRPVAVFTANPNPILVDQIVTFDPASTDHGHPDRRIVRYQWDFDASDGLNFDVDTDTSSDPDVRPRVTHSYGTGGTYTTTLRVTDDNVPARTDDATLEVRVVVLPPQALNPADDFIRRFPEFDLKVLAADLLANDPDNENLIFVDVGQPTSGATTFYSDPWVFYQRNGVTVNDSFPYAVRNAAGATGTATVTVQVIEDLRVSLNITSIEVDADGNVCLELRGIPGRSYRIQFTTVPPPITSSDAWVTLGTEVADTTGRITFKHLRGATPPPDSAVGMYRSVSP